MARIKGCAMGQVLHGSATTTTFFKSRCAHALGTTGLALILGVAPGSFACAQTAPVSLPNKSFPESVTSTKDGTLYVGSFNLGGVMKAAPGGKAEQFIKPGGGGSRSVLGVL